MEWGRGQRWSGVFQLVPLPTLPIVSYQEWWPCLHCHLYMCGVCDAWGCVVCVWSMYVHNVHKMCSVWLIILNIHSYMLPLHTHPHTHTLSHTHSTPLTSCDRSTELEACGATLLISWHSVQVASSLRAGTHHSLVVTLRESGEQHWNSVKQTKQIKNTMK